MTTSYLHPDHIPACLQDGDFVICTTDVKDRLNLRLKVPHYASIALPEAIATDSKVMVIGGKPDGSLDYEEVIDVLESLPTPGTSWARDELVKSFREKLNIEKLYGDKT